MAGGGFGPEQPYNGGPVRPVRLVYRMFVLADSMKAPAGAVPALLL